jgi:hypothetical protein
MRVKDLCFPMLVATAALALQVPGTPGHLRAAQQELPPVSYICPMDAEVLEVKPGTCPICKMDLEPVRIDTAWSCPNHAAVIRDKPGTCPIDKRELVQVIVAKYWSCAENPKVKLGDPGKCGDGSPRVMKTELRAHGDHNPRHGGQFFMAEDKWHHLEGTYPSAGLVRMFFYDNFTKPLTPKAFTGSVIVEENGKEAGSFPLTPSRDGQTLEAKVTGAPATVSPQAPLKIAAKVKFDAKTPEQRFDFAFPEYSKEPPSTPAATTTRATTPAPKPAPAVTPVPKPEPPKPPASSAAGPVIVEEPSRETPPTISAAQSATATNISRADAQLIAENLPKSSAELLKLLEQRTQEVNQAIQDGQYGYVYIPTMLAKDIALAIDDNNRELPEQKRVQASEAVRRLVLASWLLDLYGDLGNKEKIAAAYSTFAAAFADIKAAYASR